jgi:lipoyl(octanoyl) transferase
MTSTPFFPGDRRIEISIFDNPVRYAQGYRLQTELHREVAAGEIPDQVLILEHTPVYTLGKRGENGDFLTSRRILEENGAEIAEIDRGGQITYHGPGQIVLYVISNLGDRARSIRKFVSSLEQVVIDYLEAGYGITGNRDPKHPGVWVGDEKIAALGISIHERTTMHGFALNISTDLSAFDAIVPCGIRDRRVISVRSLMEHRVPGPGELGEEMETIAGIFTRTFGYRDESPSHLH